MPVTEYFRHSKWLPRVIKILLFISILMAISEGNPKNYFIIIDWFAVIGFAFLAYVSSVQNKLVSAWLLGICAITFFTGMNGLSQEYIFSRNIWTVIDSGTCTVLITNTVYDLAIDIMKKDYDKEIAGLYEKLR